MHQSTRDSWVWRMQSVKKPGEPRAGAFPAAGPAYCTKVEKIMEVCMSTGRRLADEDHPHFVHHDVDLVRGELHRPPPPSPATPPSRPQLRLRLQPAGLRAGGISWRPRPWKGGHSMASPSARRLPDEGRGREVGGDVHAEEKWPAAQLRPPQNLLVLVLHASNISNDDPPGLGA